MTYTMVMIAVESVAAGGTIVAAVTATVGRRIIVPRAPFC